MENFLIAFARPLPLFTLQHWTAIKITTILLNNQKLLSLVVDFQIGLQSRIYAKAGNEWKSVQSLAKELLSEICICNTFKQMILELLWPLSYRIMLWECKYAPTIGNKILRRFYWTSRGNIDNRRTGRDIIGNRNIPMRDRFTLACSLCLRDEIHTLWLEMPHTEEDTFINEFNASIRPLLMCWVYIMKRYVNEYETCLIDALECAITLGLSEAVKYLFSIAPECLKEDLALLCGDELSSKVMNDSFLEEDEIEIGYFLFSLLSYRNQDAFFNLNTALTFLLILHSSEREYFLKEMEKRLPFAPIGVIRTLLYVIFYNYHLEIRKDCDYYELFVDVWPIIPVSVRNSIIGVKDVEMHFLSLLIKDEFRFLFSGGVPENIEDLDSFDLEDFPTVTAECFDEDKWEFLNFLIEEGMVTNSSLKKDWSTKFS